MNYWQRDAGGRWRLLAGARVVFALLAVAIATFAVLVPEALGATECDECTPWWHLETGTRPTYLQGGQARGELQELVTTPGEYEHHPDVTNFTIRYEESSIGEFATEPLEAEYGLPAPTAANIQKVLEERAYGAGNVIVTEKAGEAGEMRYVITSVGADANRGIKPIEVVGEANSTAKATVVTKGRADGQIFLAASNLGDAGANGELAPVIIKDKLPSGLTGVEYEAISGGAAGTGVRAGGDGRVECELVTPKEPETVTCTFAGAFEGKPKTLPPYGQIEVRIGVDVKGSAHTGESNRVSVAGGGARGGVSVVRPITISGAPVPFGLEDYEVSAEEEGGAPDTQAGSHPFQTTFTIDLNEGEAFEGLTGEPEAEPAGSIKGIKTKLPPGLIGNPTPFPRCTLPEFETRTCPAETVVGAANVRVNEPAEVGLKSFVTPVFNLEPTVGEPARFGFLPTKETPVFIDASVRSGEDYGITGESSNIVQVAGDLRAQVTLWGTPGDPRHNSARGGCLEAGLGPCVESDQPSPAPFLMLPTSCPGHPLSSEAEADSWTDPHEFVHVTTGQFAPMQTLDGCNRLPFEPTINVTPDGTEASKPMGLNVDVHVPQAAVLNDKSLEQAAVKDITVTLPEGIAINPAAADGLEACTDSLVGFEGLQSFDPLTEPEVSMLAFTPKLPGGDGSSEPLEPGRNFCSNASKVGEATIKTPLLANPLKGAVYLAGQEANPFDSLVAIYIVVEDPVSGVVIKVAGQVHLTATGQIVTTFEDSPQAPFEDAEIHFFGGERAPLASPSHCGSYTTTASFVPWSAEPSDEAVLTAHSSSSFQITSGPDGTSCPGASLPFKTALTAGTTSIQAGGFSPFTTTLSREDGSQSLQAVQLKMPEGLEGLLSGVQLCPEPQADVGTCGANSLIGETTVSVGVGGDPFTVKGGKVYLTGPYEGAPFGLSIVNPAKAGPYDLADTKGNHPPCDCVLVRAKIEVNPLTAALTVTSDDSGPYRIPTVLEGVPLQIQHVNVTINRPKFTFNGTDCNRTAFEAELFSSEGATQALSTPFQVTNCAILKFTPSLTVTTAGRASKRDGAALRFKIAYPKGAMGAQAWFGAAKFDIPKQLPARLNTLQQACLAVTFETDRAHCPKHSIIGSAIVRTQVLPVPLEGPIYFVSYGSAKFPDAVIVLHGYGITIEMRGSTFINKKTGVTSATFSHTPDVPFESIEVNLPTGEFSEFGANLPHESYDFCGRKLTMPTALVAANGLEIHENTPVGITNCAKRTKKSRAGKKAAAKGSLR